MLCAACSTASVGRYRDIVLLNAAAALVVAGKVEIWRQGVAQAVAVVDGGRARDTLDRLVAITNQGPDSD